VTDPPDGGQQADPVADIALEQVRMGWRLRKRRVEQGVALSTLAIVTGIDEVRLHAYERGEMRVSEEHIYQLANALDTSIPSIFGRTC
jgi:transcriptional regulator with XRE-family HTH domain